MILIIACKGFIQLPVYKCGLFRRCHRLPVGPQQEADDLLSERTSAATRETGLLISHVCPHFFFPISLPFYSHLFFLYFLLYLLFLYLLSLALTKPPFCLSHVLGRVSLLQPALCHTNSVSLTSGPSLFVTHLLSSSAHSMTLLHCCPVKRSYYPGEK